MKSFYYPVLTSLRKLCSRTTDLLAVLVLLTALPCTAQEDSVAEDWVAGAASNQDVVSYQADFFARYRPNTALDMVLRLPGFLLKEGEDKRGLGAAAGNILIDDRYPSAKKEKPSELLARIPANQVARIDVIRNQARGIDLRGEPIVASVILLEDVPVAGQWDLAVRKIIDLPPATVRSAVSVSDQWKSIEYNAGLVHRRFHSSETGTRDARAAAGTLLSAQDQDSELGGDQGNVNLTLLSWLGKTLVSLNTQYAFEDRSEQFQIVSADRGPGSDSNDYFIDTDKGYEFEVGADIERRIDDRWLAKAILLHNFSSKQRRAKQESFSIDSNPTLIRDATSDVRESESVARLELTWARSSTQLFNLSFDAARNIIDGKLELVVDDGSGPVVVPVPGGNTRVLEDRFDLLLSATRYADEWEINYGLGAETSVINQTGDVVAQREFFFLKPQLAISRSPSAMRQTRLRIAREVAQLDFNDFVSSTVFQDDDVALGNPDLEPQSTWLAELSEERRFGQIGVLRGTLFYNWISDVQDLLPITSEFEAPGNIGSGRLWGLQVETTLPLDKIGVRNGRLDIEARLQDSAVTDPVTGDSRELSGIAQFSKPLQFNIGERFAYAVNVRQDFEDARFAWGGSLRKRDDRFAYNVNELVRYSDGYEFNMFAETTRWWGLRAKLELNNLFNFLQLRDRTIYFGERELTPVEMLERLEITDGRRIIVSLSGSF